MLTPFVPLDIWSYWHSCSINLIELVFHNFIKKRKKRTGILQMQWVYYTTLLAENGTSIIWEVLFKQLYCIFWSFRRQRSSLPQFGARGRARFKDTNKPHHGSVCFRMCWLSTSSLGCHLSPSFAAEMSANPGSPSSLMPLNSTSTWSQLWVASCTITVCLVLALWTYHSALTRWRLIEQPVLYHVMAVWRYMIAVTGFSLLEPEIRNQHSLKMCMCITR